MERLISINTGPPNPYKGLEEFGAYAVPPEADAIRVLRGEQMLMHIRVGHAGNVKGIILGAWEDFVANTRPEDREIYVEGKIRLVPEGTDLDTAFAMHGEKAILWLLSQGYNVPIFSGEPEGPREFQKLLNDGHDPQAMLFYLTYRHIPQWYYMLSDMQTDIPEHTQHVLNANIQRFGQFGTWEGLSFESLFTKFFPNIIVGVSNLYDPFFAAEQTQSYWEDTTEIQRVAVAWNIERNAHLMSTLEERLDAGRSIFTCYGWPHGYRLEQKLMALGESASIITPYTHPNEFRKKPILPESATHAGVLL